MPPSCSAGRFLVGVPALVERAGLDDCVDRVRGVVRSTVAELSGAVVACIELHRIRTPVSLAGFGYFPSLAVRARPFGRWWVKCGVVEGRRCVGFGFGVWWRWWSWQVEVY